MDAAGLTRSMSKKGCSPDNAACEGFFGRMKNEMFYGRSWLDVSGISPILCKLQNDNIIKVFFDGRNPHFRISSLS